MTLQSISRSTVEIPVFRQPVPNAASASKYCGFQITENTYMCILTHTNRSKPPPITVV
ncbi:uncharacterized protein RNJ42_00583 [Nakaseomyces bracarensis]|uniref:uncharacterized protein n=1 Tax=Nakaseomyces bracarensis TaxID=273131 RepID=UPI003871269E